MLFARRGLIRNVMSPFCSNTSRLIVALVAVCLSLALLSCTKNPRQPDYSELLPILKQHNLTIANDPRRVSTGEIEEADSILYGPLAGTTLYLEAPATFDSKNIRPRYWLRVEDFDSAEKAAKRVSEYEADGTYDRLRPIDARADKLSVRMWAIARGKRVYALTTDSGFLTYIALQRDLRKSISMLPET